MNLKNQQFLFIIGSPRSGTTMLQVLLGSHPQVATTVELSLFDQYVVAWLEKWETERRAMVEQGRRRGLPMLWSEEEAYDFLREFLARAYAKVVERYPGRTHLLDKNPSYSLCVPTIKRLLPGARFIHMVRDGRDVATSLRAASEAMGFGVDRFTEGAYLWRRYVTGARTAARFGADYLELRYEDFVQAAPEQYARVLDFCGLPADLAWIAKTLEENTFEKMKARRATADPQVQSTAAHYRQGKAGSWKTEFTRRDAYEFDHVAGRLLRELGYGEPGEWPPFAVRSRIGSFLCEARRRRKIIAVALAMVRATLFGSALPNGSEHLGL